MKLQDKGYDKAILYLVQKLNAVIAQINSVTEGHGRIIVDTIDEESGSSGTDGNVTDGSGDFSGENETGGSGTEPTTKVEGSGGEGSGGRPEVTEKPTTTTTTTTMGNNVGVTERPPRTTRKQPSKKPTEPCNPNDLDCLPAVEYNDGGDRDVINAVWKTPTKEQNTYNAGSLLTTNLLLIALSALAYLVL